MFGKKRTNNILTGALWPFCEYWAVYACNVVLTYLLIIFL